jgi:hypothetical protein
VRTVESSSDEIKRLRRCVCDLIALSALPRIWIDKTPAEIAAGFVDMLQRGVRPDLVYVRLRSPAEDATSAAAWADGRCATPAEAEVIGNALAPWLETEGFLSCRSIPNPAGSGTLQLAVSPMGFAGEYGVVAVGSLQPDFPTELHRLVLDVSIH